jgi:hypothetical protein
VAWRLRVNFDRSSRFCLPVHVRFAAKATDMQHCRETTPRAIAVIPRLAHTVSVMHLHASAQAVFNPLFAAELRLRFCFGDIL